MILLTVLHSCALWMVVLGGSGPARLPVPNITIRHIGEEDKPVKTIVIVRGDVAARHAWGMVSVSLSPPIYDAVMSYVVGQEKRASAPPGVPPFGTFEVRWRSNRGAGSYVVASNWSCEYLRRLNGVGGRKRGRGVDELINVVDEALKRLGCSRHQASSPGDD
jgi:hypothetical protein